MKFLPIMGVLLFTLVCVSSAGASGMVKFHIPEISNAAVGDTVDATLYIDNNLKPLSSDISLNLDWNTEIIQYQGTDFSAGHTTSAEPYGTHQLHLLISDHTNGIAIGDNVPVARLKFKVLAPGVSPIEIKVVKVTDLSGADITGTAVSTNGQVTTTGTASTAAVTTTQTTVMQTTATIVTPSTTVASNQVQVVNPGLATVPANTGVFAIGSIGNVAVGQTGGVTLYVNNAWNPPFGDTYIDVTWDPSIAEYVSTDIMVPSNTTAAEGGNGRVRVALGDFRNGYPAGSYPIATINLKALKDGTTPLTVTIDHVRYWSSDLSTFTDITASAAAVNGVFSTGAVSAPTQVIVTPLPVDTVGTIATPYIAPSGPVSFGDSSSSSGGDVYTGVGGEPTAMTTATTVPTTVPTTEIVTSTTTPATSEPTLIIQSTLTMNVQNATTTVPTTKMAGADFGFITLFGLAAAGVLLLAGRRT
ncbi:hypothetical protein [Methanosphaerula subterraneus]|uniref:hypothetical protein n=1 Tax=Methanosphaerula subterraneus TaxID=3350244 RepID=UPI003F830D2F